MTVSTTLAGMTILIVQLGYSERLETSAAGYTLSGRTTTAVDAINGIVTFAVMSGGRVRSLMKTLGSNPDSTFASFSCISLTRRMAPNTISTSTNSFSCD